MSVVLIVASVATLRYELAIVLPATHEEAANVMAGCVGIACVLALLTGALISFGSDWILGEAFHDELRGWLWSIPPLIVLTGLYQAINSWCTRTQEFKWYALSQASLPFMTIGFQLAAAAWGMRTSSGLILGSLMGQAIVVLLLLTLIWARYGRLIQGSVSGSAIRATLIRYKAYPLYMTPYTLVGTVRERIVYFLFATFGERSSLGFYNLSSRLVNLPNSLVSSAVRPVFFQHAASTDFRLLETPVNRALRFLAVCLVPFWVIFIFHAEALFALVFGEPWRDAGVYAMILSVPAVPLLLGNWLDRAFDALGRQRLAFALELVFSVISVVALALGVLFFEDVLVAVCLQAGVLTVYYSCWLVSLFHVAGFRRRELLNLLAVIAALGASSSVIAWTIRSVTPVFVSFAISTLIFSTLVLTYMLRQWALYNQKSRGAVE